CDIVIKLGKRPLVWADIALKYPEAIKLLPKETIFVDWNYGWDMNKFGDHAKLMESGFEIWGSPSLRCSPDNYSLTQWEKHFDNIRDFIPAARKLGYKGMIMTSWSTSGLYSMVNETNTDLVDLYAIRHVYPLTGFNLLLAAYTEGINSQHPLDIHQFITEYCNTTYGFNKAQSAAFWNALKAAPYEVNAGKVVNKPGLSLQGLLDSARLSAKEFHELKPLKNRNEFEQYRLMADIRVQYLAFQNIEKQVNEASFTISQIPFVLKQLEDLMAKDEGLSRRFTALNKGYYHPSEIEAENQLRKARIQLLYDRLSRRK
ncbi:MAG: beta-N-acetylhexosaminidase, partial [Bacteroidota bacterium]|nr:beta-N-acetylhexosaminidase [Bacteroidota bacterium]